MSRARLNLIQAKLKVTREKKKALSVLEQKINEALPVLKRIESSGEVSERGFKT